MRKDYVRSTLSATFEQTLDSKPALGGGADTAMPVLRLIVQVLDEAAAGEDCYVTFGVTKNKDAAVVTLGINGQRQYASGADWPSLLRSVESLL